MAEDRIAFGILQGASEEQFVQITFDAGGFPKDTSDPMTESELRTFLRNNGLDNTTVELRIQKARQNPV